MAAGQNKIETSPLDKLVSVYERELQVAARLHVPASPDVLHAAKLSIRTCTRDVEKFYETIPSMAAAPLLRRIQQETLQLLRVLARLGDDVQATLRGRDLSGITSCSNVSSSSSTTASTAAFVSSPSVACPPAMSASASRVDVPASLVGLEAELLRRSQALDPAAPPEGKASPAGSEEQEGSGSVATTSSPQELRARLQQAEQAAHMQAMQALRREEQDSFDGWQAKRKKATASLTAAGALFMLPWSSATLRSILTPTASVTLCCQACAASSTRATQMFGLLGHDVVERVVSALVLRCRGTRLPQLD